MISKNPDRFPIRQEPADDSGRTTVWEGYYIISLLCLALFTVLVTIKELFVRGSRILHLISFLLLLAIFIIYGQV